jgi:hypothetical protein
MILIVATNGLDGIQMNLHAQTSVHMLVNISVQVHLEKLVVIMILIVAMNGHL